ncbi:hypothetical protein [Castellaniella sp.]|uniref:hypothetical protein n=1 Tax=Castellaniella sp. TaxID=1955812 RepID=UPI0035614D83
MKKMYNSDIRLTDALERQLLQEAIDAYQTYWLDERIKQLFLKVLHFFKAPEAPTQGSVRTAH